MGTVFGVFVFGIVFGVLGIVVGVLGTVLWWFGNSIMEFAVPETHFYQMNDVYAFLALFDGNGGGSN